MLLNRSYNNKIYIPFNNVFSMEKAVIFLGVRGNVESYQLLVDTTFDGVEFDRSKHPESVRDGFYDMAIDFFVGSLLETKRNFVVGVMNGRRINPESKKLEIIGALNSDLAAEFGKRLCDRYMQFKPAIPASMMN